MTLRTVQERLVQTLSFEVTGIVLVTPIYALVAGSSATVSMTVIAILSIAVMIWSPLHNTVFDFAERHLTGRLASDRPHGLRIVHAISHEVTAVIVTCPLLILIGGHSVGTALMFNAGLTLFYTIYAYVFHLIYDWLRPVRPILGTHAHEATA